MRTRKIRHQFYLDEELGQKLAALAAKPGASKTAILTEALASWFTRKNAHELDQLYGPRFDQLARPLGEIERRVVALQRNSDAVLELLAVFIQHQMCLVAHQPAFDEQTSNLGRERFGRILDIVERRLAKGGTSTRFKEVH